MSYTENQGNKGYNKGKNKGGLGDQDTTKGFGETESTQNESQNTGTQDWKEQLLATDLGKEAAKGKEGGDPQKDKGKRNRDFGQEQKTKFGNEEKSKLGDEEESLEEEEGGEEEIGEGEATNFEEAGRKAMKYLEDKVKDIDKAQLAKYAAVGVLLLAGLRKSGFIGGLAVTIAAGVITKYIAENASEFLGEEEEGEEEETEETSEGSVATA
jgi:hypothetical protein